MNELHRGQCESGTGLFTCRKKAVISMLSTWSTYWEGQRTVFAYASESISTGITDHSKKLQLPEVPAGQFWPEREGGIV